MEGVRPKNMKWDVGERPTVPIPYFKLPAHHFVHAHLRQGPELRAAGHDLEYASRELHAAQIEMHERRKHQRRPGEGWASKFHPKALDYRTVDELKIHPDELVLDRKPARESAALQIVETEFHGDDLAQGRAKPARQLESGKKAYGFVDQFRYEYFKVGLLRHVNTSQPQP